MSELKTESKAQIHTGLFAQAEPAPVSEVELLSVLGGRAVICTAGDSSCTGICTCGQIC